VLSKIGTKEQARGDNCIKKTFIFMAKYYQLMKSRRMSQEGYVACMGEKRNT
jgi:hypothetical protein